MPNTNSTSVNDKIDVIPDYKKIELTGKHLEVLCTQLKEIVQNICVNDKFSNLRYDLVRYEIFCC